MKILMTIFIILFAFPLVGLADVEGCGFIGGWNHMMNFGYGGIFMWLIFAVILVVVIYFINNSKSNGSHDRLNKTSLDIIKERYAKGEISEEEFEKMKRNLTS
jgi:putative membrane protein